MCLSLVSFFHYKPCHNRAAYLRFCRHCFCPTCSYYTTNSILPGQTYGTHTVPIRYQSLNARMPCTIHMDTVLYIYEYPTTQCTLRSGLIGHVPVWMQVPDHLLEVRSNRMMTCGIFLGEGGGQYVARLTILGWVCIGDPATHIDLYACSIEFWDSVRGNSIDVG